jgi:hypothetical protein
MRLLRKWLGNLRGWLSDWLRRRPTPIKSIRVEELPDELDGRTLYVVGEAAYLWFTAMACPCGCGEILYMSLLSVERPHWKLIEHPDGTASLSPSVWRVKGCCSHFWLRRGMVEWCHGDTTRP